MNHIHTVSSTLIQLIQSRSSTSFNDQSETLTNACWAITYLTEDNDDVVEALVERQSNFLSTVVSLLGHESTPIRYVALRMLGNFTLSGYIDYIIDAGAMNYTCTLFTNHDRIVRNEACYFLSLIAANGTECIDTLINSPSSDLKLICTVMQNSTLSERMEATWVMFNICNDGTDVQLKSLVDIGAIPALCYNLNVPDIKFTLLVLDSIENLLMVGERLALNFTVLLEECGGREKIESLLTAENDDVYRKSNSIYEEYFEECNTAGSMDEWDDYGGGDDYDEEHWM